MRLTGLPTAFALLTRLPVARFAAADPARCVWAFPLVGLAVNATGGVVYWLARAAGIPPLLASAWTLAAMMVATGGFHEDGLADTADGFGGGANAARKLEIMRDSRIGSYGALALMLSVIVRIAAIAAIGEPRHVITALIVAGMLGRSGMLILLLVLPPARGDGLGSAISKPLVTSTALGLAIAVMAPFLCLPVRPALAAVLCGFGSCLALAKIAHAQVGGQTGDVLGAGEVVTECVVMTVLASAFSEQG